MVVGLGEAKAGPLPPTLDPTYGMEDKHNPNPGDVPYLNHLVIYPKSVQAVTGADEFNGLDTFAKPGEASGKLTPNPLHSDVVPVLIVDFGQELAGRVQVSGTNHAKVIVTTGESREECDHEEPALDNRGPTNIELQGSSPASNGLQCLSLCKVDLFGRRNRFHCTDSDCLRSQVLPGKIPGHV